MLKQYMLSWSECVQSFRCPVVGDHLVVRCNNHLPRECQQRLGCILNERWKMEERRLVDKMVLDGKRAGLNLPDAEREQLTQLKKELSQTCLEFSVSTSRPCDVRTVLTVPPCG